jgi:hypothetical protein
MQENGDQQKPIFVFNSALTSGDILALPKAFEANTSNNHFCSFDYASAAEVGPMDGTTWAIPCQQMNNTAVNALAGEAWWFAEQTGVILPP